MLLVTGRGRLPLLGVLVFVGAATLPAAAAGALAVAAAGLRWSTTSLAAVAGAQSVLGPAVAVGSLAEAGSAVLAAVGLLVATSVPRRRPVAVFAAVVLGLVAATVAVAPTANDGVAPRAAALAVGAMAGLVAASLPASRWRSIAGVGCAVGAALLAVVG